MTRQLLQSLIILSIVASRVLAADDSTRYDELLKTEEPLKTIKSLGVAMMVLPYDHENVVKQLRDHFWANSPDAQLNDSTRDLENAKFTRQLDAIRKLMANHKVHAVDLIGFTPVGSLSFLDLYYLFETDHGPIVIRASMHFRKGGGRLFGFESFEGWDKVRELIGQIRHHSGATTLSIKFKPPKQDDGEKL